VDQAVTAGSQLSPDDHPPAETRPRLSLEEPLPSDVFASAAGPLAGYRCYPTFTGQWFWRRTAIFGPTVAAVGALQGLLIAIQLSDNQLGVLSAAVGIPIWLIIVTAGPALATFVRHRRWPLNLERVAVVSAILLGLVVSCVGQYVAAAYNRAVLGPRVRAYLAGPAIAHLHTPDPALMATVWALTAALFLSLGGGLALRSYFREQRSWEDAQHARELALLRQEKNEADLRLTILQAQVEPHFLFNTLASIHSLIRSDPDRAEATMEALVDHLRATMPRTRGELGSLHSTLAQQLDVCESYLDVMRVRMGNRLRFTIDVPESLRGHPFPPLMLISLIENAIKHGVEPSPSGGNIVVSAAIEPGGDGQRLAVSVIDDGVGLRSAAGGGVGLVNIREQLAARFGSRGTLLVRGRTVGGVTATIRLPYAETHA
jgi:two-component sensor histidine kinase